MMIRVFALSVMLIFSGSVAASGSSGGGGYGSDYSTPQPKVVDQRYELGKAIYLGRAPNTKKYKYCVEVDGKPKKIKSSRLKPFKNGTRQALADALINCKQPDQRVLSQLDKGQQSYVLYYLNKRYKLRLRN